MLKKVSMRIPYKALTLNSIDRTGHKTFIRYKTKEAREFKANVWDHMDQHGKTWESMARSFIDYKHGFILGYTFFFTQEIILTKPRNKTEGPRLSNRVGDVDNYAKYTTDCIFAWMGVDDRFVIDTNLKKRPSLAKNSILASLQMIDLDTHKDYAPFIQ